MFSLLIFIFILSFHYSLYVLTDITCIVTKKAMENNMVFTIIFCTTYNAEYVIDGHNNVKHIIFALKGIPFPC